MDEKNNVNAAIIERLEKVVETLQDNSVKMGQLLAVHNEKLEKQDRIDGVYLRKLNRFIERSTVRLRRLRQDVREIFAR